MRNRQDPPSETLQSHQNVAEPAMPGSSSETLLRTPAEPKAHSIHPLRARKRDEAAAPSRRNVKGPPKKEGFDEVLACNALIGLGGVILLLAADTIIYLPKTVMTQEGVQNLGGKHGLKAANTVVEAVTSTVTETVIEYITVTPTPSTTASIEATVVTTAASVASSAITTTPTLESGIVFSTFRCVSTLLIVFVVAPTILTFLFLGVWYMVDSWSSNNRSSITPMEEPVMDPAEVHARFGEREHPLAGLWLREELQVAERKRREQCDLDYWRHQEWERGRADRMCRERIERLRPPPRYDEAVRSANTVLDYTRALQAENGGLRLLEPPHGGPGWTGTAQRRRP